MSELSWSFYSGGGDLGGMGGGPPMPVVQSNNSPQYNPHVDQMVPQMTMSRDSPPGAMGGSASIQGQPGVPSPKRQDIVAKQEVGGSEGFDGSAYTSSEKLPNIGNYKQISDYLYIFIGVFGVVTFLIFLVRFYPDIFGRNLNRWFDLFGLSGFLAQGAVLMVLFVVGRYVYTHYIKEKLDDDWSLSAFTGTMMGVSIFHDLLLYHGVAKMVPRGINSMLDVIKDHGESAGSKVLFGDAALVGSTAVVSSLLKGMSGSMVFGFLGVASYLLPYFLHTRNEYSIVR